MNHKIRCNENKCEKFSEPKNDKVQPDIFMVIILTIFLTSTAIGQRKVVMKNATDCPMKVGVIYYNTVTADLTPATFFSVQPQNDNATSIPQNHLVCLIFVDVNIDGGDELKLSGDDPGIPNNSNFDICHGATSIYPHACYDDYDLSFESGSYYLSIWTETNPRI